MNENKEEALEEDVRLIILSLKIAIVLSLSFVAVHIILTIFKVI